MNKLSLLLTSLLLTFSFSQVTLAASKTESTKNQISIKDTQPTLKDKNLSSKKTTKQVKVATRQAINLNTANAKDIADNLVGVGLKRAESIVAYRQAHGEFKNIEDLALVKGVGVKIIAKNDGMILLK